MRPWVRVGRLKGWNLWPATPRLRAAARDRKALASEPPGPLPLSPVTLRRSKVHKSPGYRGVAEIHLVQDPGAQRWPHLPRLEHQRLLRDSLLTAFWALPELARHGASLADGEGIPLFITVH